ncbi:MAG TPA: hypothetical protein VEY11_07145 [Pyrinomonadaceae bacterium]|nr:hypothetical protein [Pyrinomonadaceae bacterium]
MRFVQPELIYSLRQGLVMVKGNKAFIDKVAGRPNVDVVFRKLLMNEARYETRTHDATYILNERINKIKELYRLLDLRRPVPPEFIPEQKPQVCIVELGGLLANLGRHIEANIEHNDPVVNASALLRYVGNEIKASQGDLPFENDEEIDNWFIQNPISIEQVIEIMIAAVVGLAHRQQSANVGMKENTGEGFIDPWPEIKKLEKRLRRLVRSEFQKKYRTDDKVHTRMKDVIGDENYNECLRNMEKSRKRTPEIALDFLDFVYLGHLETLIFKEWDIFGKVFPDKGWLKNKVEKIIQVRNEEAHNRKVATEDRMLVVGYCSEIRKRIENFEAGNV